MRRKITLNYFSILRAKYLYMQTKSFSFLFLLNFLYQLFSLLFFQQPIINYVLPGNFTLWILLIQCCIELCRPIFFSWQRIPLPKSHINYPVMNPSLLFAGLLLAFFVSSSFAVFFPDYYFFLFDVTLVSLGFAIFLVLFLGTD